MKNNEFDFLYYVYKNGLDGYRKIAQSTNISLGAISKLANKFKEIEDPEKLAMELEQERQETKKQPITENCMQSVRNIAVTRKASEVRKASHEVKEEYAKIENLVQDNEEEKE